MRPLATLALYFASAITYIDASVYTVKCYQCAYNFPQPYPTDGVPMNYDYVWRKPPVAACLSGSVDDLSPYLQDCSGHRELQEGGVWDTSPALLTCYTTFFYSDQTKTKPTGVIRDCVKASVLVDQNTQKPIAAAKEFGVGGMCFAGVGTTTRDKAHKTSSTCACDPVAASDGCNVWSKILPYSGADGLYGEDPRLENNDAPAPPVSKPATGGSATNPAKPASPNNPTSPGDPAEPTKDNANGGGIAVAADVANANNGAVGVSAQAGLFVNFGLPGLFLSWLS